MVVEVRREEMGVDEEKLVQIEDITNQIIQSIITQQETISRMQEDIKAQAKEIEALKAIAYENEREITRLFSEFKQERIY